MNTRIQIALRTSISGHRFRMETNDWITYLNNRLKKRKTDGFSVSKLGINSIDHLPNFYSRPSEFVQQVFEPPLIRQGLIEITKDVENINMVLFNNRLRYYEASFKPYDVAYLKATIDWLIEITGQIEKITRHRE